MDRIRVVGLSIVVLGALFLLSFFATSVNPNVELGFLGLLTVLLGCLVITANFFRKRVRVHGVGLPFTVFGFLLLSTGLLVGFAGFLLENQVVCMCPASGPCPCGVPLYDMMFTGGLLTSLIGAASVTVGAVLSHRRPVQPSPDHKKMRLSRRGMTVLAIVITVFVVFAVFSYWPGIYVTSINEQTQFHLGIPTRPEGLMTSPTIQSGAGFQIPVGGTFEYVLQFSSVPSYPTYRINTISMGEGFSVTNTNATLPLVISSSHPSVSLTFTVRGPYYPYHGPVSFLITIEKLNQTGN